MGYVALALPSGPRRPPVGIDPTAPMIVDEGVDRLRAGLGRSPAALEVLAAARVDEDGPPLAPPYHTPSSFVQEAMVMMAGEERISKARLATVGPVLHVVRVGEAGSAARKAASAVADLQGAAERRRDRARPAAHIEHGAIGSVGDFHHARVAGEPATRFT